MLIILVIYFVLLLGLRLSFVLPLVCRLQILKTNIKTMLAVSVNENDTYVKLIL